MPTPATTATCQRAKTQNGVRPCFNIRPSRWWAIFVIMLLGCANYFGCSESSSDLDKLEDRLLLTGEFNHEELAHQYTAADLSGALFQIASDANREGAARIKAVSVLGELGTPSSLDALCKLVSIYQNDHTSWKNESILSRALVEMTNHKAGMNRQLLVDVIKDQNLRPELRTSAAYALASHAEPVDASVLLHLYDSLPRHGPRVAFGKALSRIYGIERYPSNERESNELVANLRNMKAGADSQN